MKKTLLALAFSMSFTSAFAAGTPGDLKGFCEVKQGSVVQTFEFDIKSSAEGYVSQIIKNNGSDYKIYVTNTAGLDLSYENNLIEITVTPMRYFENPPALEEVEVDDSRTFQNPPNLEDVTPHVFPVSGMSQTKNPKNGDELYLNLYNKRIDFSCYAKFTTK